MNFQNSVSSQYRFVGEIYEEQNKPTQALLQYSKFIEEEQNKSNNYFERAISYYTRCRLHIHQGNMQVAKEDAEAALKNIEIEIRGGATVSKAGLTEKKRLFRLRQSQQQHFRCFAQMYDIYFRIGFPFGLPGSIPFFGNFFSNF